MRANNVPPAAQQGQQQAVGLTTDMITILAQKIIQMAQTFACQKLTNGNGTNFWNEFIATALFIASFNRVCIHKFLFQNEIFIDVVFSLNQNLICRLISDCR